MMGGDTGSNYDPRVFVIEHLGKQHRKFLKDLFPFLLPFRIGAL
jgi:hypothetical protein